MTAPNLSAWQSRFCLLSTRALEEGEAILRVMEAEQDPVEGSGGKKKKKKQAAAGALGDWSEAELARRREGGLKHTEDPSGNPCCQRGHPLFQRHHPWATSRAMTQCSICLHASLALARIRYHCASKVCAGTQVCIDCADAYGSETATALLMAETRVANADDDGLFHALAYAVKALRLRTTEDSLVLSREMLQAAMGVAAPQYVQHVDTLMRYHDEAFVTEAYRAEGRMQSARLARVAQELHQRHRALERTLRALDKRAEECALRRAQARKKRAPASAVLLAGVRPPAAVEDDDEALVPAKRARRVARPTVSSSSSSSSSSSDDEDD